MNPEAFQPLLRWLDSEEAQLHFDMNYIFNQTPECGTAMCLAGATCWLTIPNYLRKMVEDDDSIFNYGVLHGDWSYCCFEPTSEEKELLRRNLLLNNVSVRARNILGLTHEQAEHLFFPGNHDRLDPGEPGYDPESQDEDQYRWGKPVFYSEITPAWAKAVILNLIETGEVDWSIR